MKTFYYVIFLFIVRFYSQSIFSQNQWKEGVYLSYEELEKNSPSYTIDSGDVIERAFPRGFNNLILHKHSQEKKKEIYVHYIFKYGSVYGYVYEKKLHRYFSSKSWKINDGYYTVEEIGKLVIYSKREYVNILFGIGYITTHYFFSQTLNSDIYPLSKKYLKNILDDHQFKKIEHLKDIEQKDNSGHFVINQLLQNG